MRQTYRTVGYFAGVAFLLISVSYGQSLGDVARQQRQNQQAKKDQPPPKVITNEDLPEHSLEAGDSEKANENREPMPHPAASRSPEQWKAEIEAQKKNIEMLQRQMDRLSATIHYVEANRYYNGVQHNLRQEQKEAEVGRMQDQMELQKKRLDDMQEAARKDGFGNAVYDP
jgi:predicted RNase H-like nuclease (RuvC/YqgF family)